MLLSSNWGSGDVDCIIPLSEQPLIYGESNNFFQFGHNVS